MSEQFSDVVIVGLTQSGKTFILQALCRKSEGYKLNDGDKVVFQDIDNCILTEDSVGTNRPPGTQEVRNCDIECTIRRNDADRQLIRAILKLIDTPGSAQGETSLFDTPQLWQQIQTAVEQASGVIFVLDIAEDIWDAYNGEHKLNPKINRRVHDNVDKTGYFLEVFRNKLNTDKQQILYCISKVDGQDDKVNEYFHIFRKLLGKIQQTSNDEDLLVETDAWREKEGSLTGEALSTSEEVLVDRFFDMVRRYNQQISGLETEDQRLGEPIDIQDIEQVCNLTVGEFREYIDTLTFPVNNGKLYNRQMYDFFERSSQKQLREVIEKYMEPVANMLIADATILPISSIGKQTKRVGIDHHNINEIAKFIYDVIIER